LPQPHRLSAPARHRAAPLRGVLLGLALSALAPAQAQVSTLNGPQVIVPPNVLALNAITQAQRLGDKPGALKLAEEAVQKFPRDAQLRFVRAVALADVDRTDDAAKAFEAMCSDFPELPEPYNNLAVIRANQGDYGEAARLLDLALTAEPGYAVAHENRGDLYVALAIRAYEKAGRLDPANTGVKKKLALARELGTQLRSVRRR
jgi:tetratricopeptide (TPR) repeat protein